MHTPWNTGEPFEIATRNVEFTCGLLECLKLGELLIKYGPYGLRHIQFGGLFLELFNELVFAIRLNTELLFDALHLFHQVVLTLALLNFVFNVLADLALQLSID